MVETSRLYARTVAAIEPEWIEALGDHICQRTFTEPRWDRKAGRVLVRQRVTLFGLTVLENQIDYGRVNAAAATDLFIRSALIEGDADLPHRFVEHNQRLRERIEVWRSRSRNHGLPDLEETLLAFYASRLDKVSSVHDLNRLWRAHAAEDPNFLCAREEDLTGGRPLGWDAAAFPPQVMLGGQQVSVTYAYAPGEEHDGVTVRIPAALAHNIRPEMLDFIIPGLREEQIAHLIKELPKQLRVDLMPTGPKAKELAGLLAADAGLQGLRLLIRARYQVDVPADAWSREQLPPHLRPRLAILGEGDKEVAAGRDLDGLKRGLQHHETPAEQQAWERTAQRYERYDLKEWSFGDLPEYVDVTSVAGSPWRGFAGLAAEGASVHLRLFRQRDEAEGATRVGWVRLAEWVLHRELGWLEKDLRALDKVAVLYATLGPCEELLTTAHANIRRHLLRPPDPILPLVRQRFENAVAGAKTELRSLVPGFVETVTRILQSRQQALLAAKQYVGMRQDLDALLPPRFLETIEFERLAHLPRYLKAILLRAERAALNPAKDREKARLVQPYLDALAKLRGPAAAEFRWLVEEYKVSVFAQELGTAQPVSPKRLDAFLKQLS
jgi:ATP-dependent helicase HrpA